MSREQDFNKNHVELQMKKNKNKNTQAGPAWVIVN